VVAISNGDRSCEGPASSTLGDFFLRGLGEISCVGDAIPFSRIEGPGERRGGVGAGRGRISVREMVSSTSVLDWDAGGVGSRIATRRGDGSLRGCS